MKVRVLAAVAALALGTALSGGAAQAATYMLSDPGSAFGSASNFGTVTVTGTSSDLHFDVLLNSPYKFVTTGSHVTFAGNLGGSNFSLGNVAGDNVTTSNFNFATGSNISDSPFNSDFDFSLDCKTGSGAPCGNNGGGGHPFGAELIFDILGTGLSVQPANNPDGSKSIYFSADVVDGAGNTGVIGATGAIPEPATWGLMITGVFAIGAAMRMQRRQAVTAA